jgi:hypothetical protein
VKYAFWSIEPGFYLWCDASSIRHCRARKITSGENAFAGFRGADMRRVNDQKLLMQLPTPEIADAREIAAQINLCVFPASIELMQSNLDFELTS